MSQCAVKGCWLKYCTDMHKQYNRTSTMGSRVRLGDEDTFPKVVMGESAYSDIRELYPVPYSKIIPRRSEDLKDQSTTRK